MRPSYLYLGSLYTWQDGIYIEMVPTDSWWWLLQPVWECITAMLSTYRYHIDLSNQTSSISQHQIDGLLQKRRNSGAFAMAWSYISVEQSQWTSDDVIIISNRWQPNNYLKRNNTLIPARPRPTRILPWHRADWGLLLEAAPATQGCLTKHTQFTPHTTHHLDRGMHTLTSHSNDDIEELLHNWLRANGPASKPV